MRNFLTAPDSTSFMTFNAAAELEAIRQLNAVRRKGSYRRSRLDRYAFELISMHREGARPAELQFWLRQKRINVALSTVTRWLEKQHAEGTI